MVRKKRAVVGREKRQQWLNSFESGMTAVQIAELEQVDIRTVRSQIDKAREEKLADSVQRELLLEKLRDHHRTLIEYIEKARGWLSDWEQRDLVIKSREDPIASALKEHIPSIWKNGLDKWEKVSNDYDKLRQEVDNCVDNKARDLGLKFGNDLNHRGLHNDARLTVMEELCRQVLGKKPLVTRTQTIAKGWGRGKESRDKDTVLLGRDIPSKSPGVGFMVGYANPGKEGDLEEKYLELREAVFKCGNATQLKKVLTERDELQKSLQGELDILILKGMVPGHCRACPI